MPSSSRTRLLLAGGTLAVTTALGFGTTTAFGQIADDANGTMPTPAPAQTETAAEQPAADAVEADVSTAALGDDTDRSVAPPDPAAVAAMVDFFYQPGEVVQYDCLGVVERSVTPDVLPDGVDTADVWLQPNGTRTELLTADGEPSGIVDLERDGDRIVLRAYDDGNVVTYDIDQQIILEAFAPCLDPDTALDTVRGSDVADLASIYHEASRNADGSIQILFVVQKDDRYSPDTFEGEFRGVLGSAEYDAFLDRMPQSVRSQVETFAEGVQDHLGG